MSLGRIGQALCVTLVWLGLGLGSASAQMSYDAFTYIGGSNFDRAQGCAFDDQGFVWVVGNTESTNFPTHAGAYDRTLNNSAGTGDGFVAKFTADLSQLIYATYIGGSREDRAYSLTFDALGFVYVVGITASSDFPTTSGAFQTNLRGSEDVWVAKFEPDLSDTVWVTQIGGDNTSSFDSDWTRGAIELDSAGNVVVAGKTAGGNFPTTTGAFDETYNGGTHDAFVAKLLPDGTDLVWATLVGGPGTESFYGNLEIGADDSVTVAGYSNASGFPTTAGAFEENFSGRSYGDFTGDGVIARISADGSTLEFGSYLWSAVSGNDGLVLDSQGRANLALDSTPASEAEVPISSGAFQDFYAGGGRDGTVARLSADGSQMEVATFLGGSGFEEISGIDIDAHGSFFIGGNTDSSNFPVTQDAVQANHGGNQDATVSVFFPDAGGYYSTYLGGSGTDRGRCVDHSATGGMLVSGDSDGGMPQAGSPADSSQNGNRDGFVAIFVPEPAATSLGAAACLALVALSRRRTH